MRVALVHPHFSRSTSLERDSVLLAAGLVAHGVEVHCYCDPVTRADDIEEVTFHDVPVVRTRPAPTGSRFAHPLERASFALAATRLLRRDRHLYDIVDVRQTAAWEHDVVTVHGVVAAMQNRWASEAGEHYRAARLRAAVAPLLRPQVGVDRAIQARQFRRARMRRVIAVTPQVRDDLVQTFGVPRERIDIVAPPIDLARVVAARPSGIRGKLGVSERQPLLLFVGNAFRRKGLDTLLEALAGLSDAHLVVVGDDDRRTVSALLAGDLQRRVHFVGGVDDPERYYAEADLFVLPTRSDPWGIPLIEAMAAGVPVISTSVAGAAAVVADARAGIILSDRSAPSLRNALQTLILSRDERTRMGERGRAAAVRFGAESHAANVLKTYRSALACADTRRNGSVVP